MLELIKSDDVWFYCLVAISVLLRILWFDETKPTVRSAFYSTLAAFLVAKTFTEPTLEWIPTSSPDKYRDALTVAYALTGNEVLRGIMFAVRRPRIAVELLKSLVSRKA